MQEVPQQIKLFVKPESDIVPFEIDALLLEKTNNISKGDKLDYYPVGVFYAQGRVATALFDGEKWILHKVIADGVQAMWSATAHAVEIAQAQL